MALDRSVTYPGFFDNPTSTRPQGAFKNETAEGAEDGSYLEQDWLNDVFGFHDAILVEADETPNGTIDEGGNSQVLTALKKTYPAINKIKTSQFVVVGKQADGVTDSPLPTTTAQSYAVGDEMALGWTVTTAVVDAIIDANGNLTATSGVVEYTFDKADNETPNAASLFASVMRCTDAANSVYVQDYADGSNGISITETTTTITMVIDFSSFAGGKVFGVSEQVGRLSIDSTDNILMSLGTSGQIWQDVLASRASGVTYTNDTGRDIEILVTAGATGAAGTSADLYIDGVQVGYSQIFNNNASYYSDYIISVKIPKGSTYSVVSARGIFYWWEFR